MDVDEAPTVTKKVLNNEIVSTENSNSNSNSETVETEKVSDKKENPIENDDVTVKNGKIETPDNDVEMKEESSQPSANVINDHESEKEEEDKVDDPLGGNEASDLSKTKEDAEEKDESKPEDLAKKSDKENGGEAMEVDGDQKVNGSHSSDERDDKQGEEEGNDDEVDGDGTPKKSKKIAASVNLTPRRSSRNLNKSKPSSETDEKDEKDIELIEEKSKKSMDDDIQEIAIDPLADTSKPKPRSLLLTDPKRLVEMSKPNMMASINKAAPKKEPTLVIIDTNSILSGRGPVPVAHSSPQPVVNRPPQLTLLPVQNKLNQNKMPGQSNKPAVPAQPPILLPSLTDDMFVVEAPSFIVPYVYEKPPVKPLKEFVDDLDKTLKKEKEDAEKEKLKKEEDKKKDKDEKEKSSEDKDKDEKDEAKTEDEANKKEGEEETDKDKKSEDKTDKDEKKSEADDEDDTKEDDEEEKKEEKKGGNTYFDNALGKFFMHIGINLVQEHVQNDLLKSQKRKREREGTKVSSDTLQAISSLTKTLEFSKENNDPFRFDTKKCEYCNFKTESQLVMAHHLETPHMKNYIYR